jgi:putative endonuclease
MVKTNDIGLKGETIAIEFLQNKSYNILNRNWRSGNKEIDIVAATGNMLVFFEVKTRTSYDFGFPEEAVNKKKQLYLKAAAAAYLLKHPSYELIRFDIISILLEGDKAREILHFEEAFY